MSASEPSAAAPRVFFLPGAGADPAFWRPVGELLPAGWRKHYFAWPGIGHQPPDPAVRSFRDATRLVVATLGDEPADLVAQSMGCAVALRVALDHPTRVRRLVLAAPAAGLDPAEFGGEDWRPGYRLEYPRAAAWITEQRADYRSELSRLGQPTLLLWGDADPISPVAMGEALRAALPRAALHVVRGGGHALAQQHAREVAQAIRGHLAA